MPCGRHRSDGSHPKHPPEHRHLEGCRGCRHQRQQGVVRVGFVRRRQPVGRGCPSGRRNPPARRRTPGGVKTTKCTGARHSAWLASIRGTSATKVRNPAHRPFVRTGTDHGDVERPVIGPTWVTGAQPAALEQRLVEVRRAGTGRQRRASMRTILDRTRTHRVYGRHARGIRLLMSANLTDGAR